MSKSSPQIRIRQARPQDAADVARLSGQLGYPATEQEMAERLAATFAATDVHSVLVAEAPSGQVIGWASVTITPLLEVPLRSEINGLVVAEEHRSLGAGAKLLEAAEQWSKEKGCREMSVRSNVVRERAHSFYLRHGYEHYKTQKAFRKPL
jgi:GNAT superfamily N-acetyltransferase